MGPLVIVIIVLAALLLAAAVVVAVRQRRSAASRAEPELAPAADDGPAPMTGLESALAQVTDRSGRPIREAIDAEAGHVDELRVPDDTGPLLRRALDHVAPPGEPPADDADDPAEAGDEASEAPASDDDAG